MFGQITREESGGAVCEEQKWRPAMETERKRFAYPAENEYIYMRNLNERKMEYMQLNTREGRGNVRKRRTVLFEGISQE